MSPKVWTFILFGILGVFGEVLETGLKDIYRNRRLKLEGKSYLWMIPIYGMISILFPIVSSAVHGQSWVFRGTAYMLVIYTVEFAAGTLLTRLTGAPIWEYRGRFQYKGQIKLAHAPVWFAVGLIVEKYFHQIEKLAQILSRGI